MDFFSVYLFLSSLHDCNVRIEFSQSSELWQCHATICLTKHTHKPNVDPKDVTFDLKSSNPWISYSFCSIACYCVRTMNIFQFRAIARSFSIRCHANLLRGKKTLHTQCQWHSIQFNSRIPCFMFAFPKKSSISLSCLQKWDEFEHIIKLGLNSFNCSIHCWARRKHSSQS